MKLRRRIKSRALIIDVSDPENPKGRVQEEYEDYFQENLFKRLIKNSIFWFNLLGIAWNLVCLIFAEDKGSIILFTIILSMFIYFEYKLIKTEHNNGNDNN